MSAYRYGSCTTEGCENTAHVYPGPPWSPAPRAYLCDACECEAEYRGDLARVHRAASAEERYRASAWSLQDEDDARESARWTRRADEVGCCWED